jgi:predicted RNase H-like HicB family nuclease
MLVKIEVYNDGEFWCARGIGEDVFTQGKTVDELYKNIREAVELHFEDRVPAKDLDILVVSELKPAHAPASTD